MTPAPPTPVRRAPRPADRPPGRSTRAKLGPHLAHPPEASMTPSLASRLAPRPTPVRRAPRPADRPPGRSTRAKLGPHLAHPPEASNLVAPRPWTGRRFATPSNQIPTPVRRAPRPADRPPGRSTRAKLGPHLTHPPEASNLVAPRPWWGRCLATPFNQITTPVRRAPRPADRPPGRATRAKLGHLALPQVRP